MLLALIAISLGGMMLHLRIHPVVKNTSNFLPLFSGILSIIIVPLLFSSKKTISYGYTLNGFLVIVGTIAMAHFSVMNWPQPSSLESILLKTTLPDIVVLWTKFFIGKALFDLELFGYDSGRDKIGVTYRYPNTGWWFVHCTAISIVYALSGWLWR
ncbi:MAG: hypothetical protein ACLQBD_08725 [Syntrophobacteraceae bacterium]